LAFQLRLPEKRQPEIKKGLKFFGTLTPKRLAVSALQIFVALYLALAWFAWKVSKATGESKEGVLWRGMSFTLVALGVNKLLEGSLTNAGRMIAAAPGLVQRTSNFSASVHFCRCCALVSSCKHSDDFSKASSSGDVASIAWDDHVDRTRSD
jgi:hypothetical protein